MSRRDTKALSIDSTNSSDHDDNDPVALKREAGTALAHATTKKPRLRRQLSEDSLLLVGAVPSAAVHSADDVARVQREARTRDRTPTKRAGRPAQDPATTQATLQVMALQLMRKMMRDMEQDDEAVVKEDVADEMHSLRRHIDAVEQQVAALRDELVVVNDALCRLSGATQ